MAAPTEEGQRLIAASMLMAAVIQNVRYESVNQKRAKAAGRTEQSQLLFDTHTLLDEINAEVNR